RRRARRRQDRRRNRGNGAGGSGWRWPLRLLRGRRTTREPEAGFAAAEPNRCFVVSRARKASPVLQTSHHIVLNSSSGTAASASVRPEQLVERFAALGHTVSIDADATRPFAERLQTARASAAPILVAAGGDGTATALAEVAIQSGKTLAVLPLGTA